MFCRNSMKTQNKSIALPECLFYWRQTTSGCHFDRLEKAGLQVNVQLELYPLGGPLIWTLELAPSWPLQALYLTQQLPLDLRIGNKQLSALSLNCKYEYLHFLSMWGPAGSYLPHIPASYKDVYGVGVESSNGLPFQLVVKGMGVKYVMESEETKGQVCKIRKMSRRCGSPLGSCLCRLLLGSLSGPESFLAFLKESSCKLIETLRSLHGLCKQSTVSNAEAYIW